MAGHEIVSFDAVPNVAPLVVTPHALTTEDRFVGVAAFLHNETLGEYIERHGIELPRGYFTVMHNGRPVPMNLWERLIPRTGDQIIIAAEARGGGDAGKVIASVAAIALVLAAPYISGYLLTGEWAIASGFAAGALSAGIAGVGLGLIGSLTPLPRAADIAPAQPQTQAATNIYSISGGRNRARLWEPMPLIFGRHKVVPDLGAKYYTQRIGDDVYLNQIFHFGLQAGLVRLYDFRIGATSAYDYQGVQIEVSGADGRLASFPGNVDTLEGFALGSGVINTRTTPPDTTYISVELAATLYHVNDDASVSGMTSTVQVQYAPKGTGAWVNAASYSQGVYATHYWSLRKLPFSAIDQVTFGSTNAGDHNEGDVVMVPDDNVIPDWTGFTPPATIARWMWVTHPYQLGQPWYGIAPDPYLGSVTNTGTQIWGARREPTYQTVGWGVAKGQYDIRIWKSSPEISDTRSSNETIVSQILCYQPDEADYAGQLRVALKIKASDQLSGAIDELSAMAEAFAYVWNGAQYVPMHTRNPAWWLLWFAAGKVVNGKLIYGAGYTEDRIDFEKIRAWARFCDLNDLRFDYELKRGASSYEMLSIIARAGRASVTNQTGKLGVIWDAANIPVTMIFGPLNIRAGTFNVEYLASSEQVDEIVGEFVNEARDYQTDQIRVRVPGATTSLNPKTVALDGILRHEQAAKDVNLLAAEQVWRRRRTTFESPISGWQVTRGDVVQVSHDLMVWDYSGRFVRLLSRSEAEVDDEDALGNPVTRTLVTAQVSITTRVPSSGQLYVMVRDPEGNMTTVQVVTEPGDVDTLELSIYDDELKLPGDPYYEGAPAIEWAFFAGPEPTPGRRFKVVAVSPADQMGVRFELVDDDPEYYASENNPYQYTPPRDGALLAGQVFAITFTEGWYNTLAKTLDLVVGWSLSVSTTVDVTVTVNGVTQAPARVESRTLKIPGLSKDDTVQVTVVPVTFAGRGKPLTQDYTIQAVAAAPAAITQMTAAPEGPLLRLRWPPAPEPDVVDYEVRSDDSNWGGMGALFVGDATTCTVDPGLGTYYVRAVNGAGLYSETSATALFTPDEVPNVSEIHETFQDTSLTNATITLTWPGVSPQFGLDTYRVSYGSVSRDADSTTIMLPADWIGDRTFKVQTIDGRGVVSGGTQKTITKLVPASPQNVFTRVIDNIVTLYWTIPAPTTLPYAYTLIKKGATWETAEVVGRVDSGFATAFEFEGGLYTYWLAIVDTDDNESAPVSIVARVNEPPDFVFQGELFSAFAGSKTQAIVEAGALLLPVDTGRTWQAHFADRSWASPSAQVSAGFALYIQPTPTPGVYQEVFDFGNMVASSRAALALDAQTVAGSPVVETVIETSSDGSSWSAPTNGTEVFATNFRYVRVTLTVSQSGAETALVRVSAMSVRLSTKLKNDGGQTTVAAVDALGTIANFNVDFLDVASITATSSGTLPRQAVCDFKDVVYSGTFSVSAGVVTVNITAHGLIAGQDVMLNFPDGPQRVTIATASTDSFTAPTTHTGSGSLTAYPQSMRIYLFDKDGVRQSGLVYWSIRGN